MKRLSVAGDGSVRLKFLQVVSVGVLVRFILNPIKVFRTSVFASLFLTSFFIYDNPVQAQQRACVITDRGTTVCGKLIRQTQSSTNKSVQSFGQKEVVGNFIYIFKDCKRSDTTVECVFTVANKGQEIFKLAYAGEFELVDSNGKSYHGSTFEFGGSKGPFASETLSPGIEYSAGVTFEQVPVQMTRFPLLRGGISGKEQKFHFRNVTISN
jgi:hypothetical protein